MILGYGLQYTMPFAALPLTEAPVLYRVQFYRRGFAGAVTELQPGDEPWREDTPAGLTGVKGKRIQLTVICQSVDLNGFYTEKERDVLVVLEYYRVAEWEIRSVGWLSPFEASESYQAAPYPLTLSASCGLAALADYPFARYPAGLAYAGDLPLHDLLYGCLVWAGYDLPLRTWTGRHETSTLQNGLIPVPAPDCLQSTFINPRRWLRPDGTYESCRRVLDDLCEAFGAILVQYGGIWYFLANDARTYPQSFHHYVSPFALYPAIVTANLMVNSPADVRWLRGAEVGLLPPKKKLVVRYEYGEAVNLLLNGDFTAGLSSWTVNQHAGRLVEMNGDGTQENQFRVKINGQSIVGEFFVPGSESLRQDVAITRGTFSVGSRTREGFVRLQTEAHLLSFTGLFVNLVTAGAKLALSVRIGSQVWYLQNDGTWRASKGGLQQVLFIENTWVVNGVSQPKPTTGERISFTSEPVPGQGNYTVRVELFAGETLQPAPATGFRSITYRDLRLALTNGSDIPLNGEKWTVQVGNTVTERSRTEDLTLTMGDQLALSATSLQARRYGALLRTNRTATSRWLLNGRLDRFQKLTGWSLLAWLAPKLRSMGGEVMLQNPARTEPGPLDTIAVSDMTPPFAGVVSRWAWSPKMRQSSVSLHEIPPSLITETYRGVYETPEGVPVPIVEPLDQTGPVPVPTNPSPRQNTAGTITGSGNPLPTTKGLISLLKRLATMQAILLPPP